MATMPGLVEIRFRVPVSEVENIKRIFPKRPARPNRVTPIIQGELVIKPAEGRSLAHLPNDLALAGYHLVSAFWDERWSDQTGKYHIVQFEFGKGEMIEKPELMLVELDILCTDWTWTARVFNNKYFLDQKEVPGEFTFMVEPCSGNQVGRHNRSTSVIRFDGVNMTEECST